MIFSMFIFQACSDDEELTIDEENLVADLRRGGQGGPGGQGGGPGGGIQADDISSELILDWSDVFLHLDQYTTGMRPNVTARAIAYINLAAYETAIPIMDGYNSMQGQLDGLEINGQQGQGVNIELALNACYADVIDHFMINVTQNADAQIAALESQKEEQLSSILSDDVVQRSIAWGDHVAQQVIAYAETDAAAEAQIFDPQPLSYEPPTGAGYWTYSADPERALFPYWETVRTFVISSEETSTVPPMAYSDNPNSPYFAQMMEVYTVNNTARDEDNEELWIAEFWSDDIEELMISPPGRQVSIAKQLIDQFDLNMEESLVMMLKLGFALNDASVSAWADKYEHMVMRPNVFIHEHIDPDFQTNLFRFIWWPNPSFPGYPSGHSCFASAAGGVFIDQFGDNVNFTDRTHEGRTEFRGEPRQYSRLSDMAEENAFSRIPLGVHIRMDCSEGLRLGYEIADAVNDLDLRRRPR